MTRRSPTLSSARTTTLIGTSNQELTYFIAWESLAEREARWNAFIADPEWLAARWSATAGNAAAPGAHLCQFSGDLGMRDVHQPGAVHR